jgi:hypothetical protein
MRREPVHGRGEISEVVRRPLAGSGDHLADDGQDLAFGQPEVGSSGVDGQHVGHVADNPVAGGDAGGVMPGGGQAPLAKRQVARARATTTNFF